MYELFTLLFTGIALIITLLALLVTINSNSPSLAFENFGMGYKENNSGPVSFSVSLKSTGNRPCKNLTTAIKILDKNFKIKSFSIPLETRNKIYNYSSIHPTFETIWNSEQKDVAKHFIIVEIHYLDGKHINLTPYRQYTYLNWEGMKDGVVKEINYPTSEESKKLDKFLFKKVEQ